MVEEPTLAPRARRPFFRMPVHPSWLVAIFVGGAIGTAIRAAISAAFPHAVGAWPWAIFIINISGALILGALLEFLALAEPDAGWRRLARLTIGTGVLGGYTTYSTFALDIVTESSEGALLLAAAYALASVFLGVTAAYVAMRTVNHLHASHKKSRVSGKTLHASSKKGSES